MQENAELTREQAEKEFGVKIESKQYSAEQFSVWLEFKPAGKLKQFSHVHLDVTAGGKNAVSALLEPTKSADGTVRVQFTTDPAFVPTSRLTIVVQESERTRIGYELNVKDFVELKSEPKKTAEVALPLYETAAQVKAMPAGKAKVEQIETYSALLSSADGKKFRIGSDRGEQEVWHFVGTALKVGQTYEFPGAFAEFEKRKFYVTTEAIKSMPPSKATLEHAGPCFSIFRGADGKQFVIGDPGSGADVWGFLNTLKKGESYELPRAFAEYLKK